MELGRICFGGEGREGGRGLGGRRRNLCHEEMREGGEKWEGRRGEGRKEEEREGEGRGGEGRGGGRGEHIRQDTYKHTQCLQHVRNRFELVWIVYIQGCHL